MTPADWPSLFSEPGVRDLIARDTPREIRIQKSINPYAQGSALVEFGLTKVHVTTMVEENVPPWMKGQGKGWLSAEYSMLPAAGAQRIRRDRKGVSGRSTEIQRLIGRCLRSVLDFSKIGERTLLIDCDVLVADGGTRTASISGAYVALAQAIEHLLTKKLISNNPLLWQVAAVSVGIGKDGKVYSDLDYKEDSQFETDMNVVMTSNGDFVEVQGTAEGLPFSPSQLLSMMECAKTSLEKIFPLQRKALE